MHMKTTWQEHVTAVMKGAWLCKGTPVCEPPNPPTPTSSHEVIKNPL